MKDLMKYKGYYGSVHFDANALIFYGKIEFIRALISYEGTNAKQLKKSFEDAINDYLVMCKEQKIEPEKPFKGSLNIRIGHELHKRVAIAAELSHLSINKFIANVLDQALKKYVYQ